MNSENGTPQIQSQVRDQLFKPFVPRPDDRNFVTAVGRSFDVIHAFRCQGGPLGNNEVAEITGLPKATVGRLTYTLCELGFLEKVKGRKYQLTVAMLALAYPVLSGLRIRQYAHDRMSELARMTQCTIALAAPNTDGTSMVYVDAFSGNTINTLRMDTGMRIDMARSAIGRAYLAGVDEVTRQNHLAALAALHGDAWPELLERIELARKEVETNGYCLVDGEWMSETRAVSVPVRAGSGNSYMAMSCGSPTFAVALDRLKNELGPQMVHVAASLENAIIG